MKVANIRTAKIGTEDVERSNKAISATAFTEVYSRDLQALESLPEIERQEVDELRFMPGSEAFRHPNVDLRAHEHDYFQLISYMNSPNSCGIVSMSEIRVRD